MTPRPDSRIGGSTSPSTHDLIKAAHLILTNCGIHLGPPKINRIVRTFTQRMPHASGWMFFAHLANTVNLNEQQRRAALTNPDIARVICYADPTGETAVNNILATR